VIGVVDVATTTRSKKRFPKQKWRRKKKFNRETSIYNVRGRARKIFMYIHISVDHRSKNEKPKLTSNGSKFFWTMIPCKQQIAKLHSSFHSW
jgi:hypothetical protein